jgi:hypothetical protein
MASAVKGFLDCVTLEIIMGEKRGSDYFALFKKVIKSKE